MEISTVLVAGSTGFLGTEICRQLRMEVWFSAAVGFDAINGKVNICGTGTNPLSYISIKDVAEFAVESISNLFLKNVAIDLGGPQNISQLDAVKIFEEVLQKKIDVQHVPVAALLEQFNNSIDPVQKSFSGLMLCVARGGRIDMKDVISKFNVELTSVKDFVYSLAETKLPVF
jgi:nucleoside-diphosphate-sugar epimerase